MTKDELNTVIEDLEFFRDEWVDEITAAEVRRGSAILRRLLVEGYLGKAWRAAGYEKEPNIVGVNLDLQIGAHNQGKIDIALAGGGTRGGITAGGMFMIQGASGPPPIPIGEDGNPMDATVFLEYSFSLTKYLESACGVANGHVIKRREIIKYMANVKGGVHLGTSSRARTSERELVSRVSKLEKKVNMCSMDGLFFELLSIGQSLAKSPDMAELISKVRNYGS